MPQEILDKPPSADLWPGQTDEDELGRSYDLLDRALFALVDRRWSVDRCVAAGLDRALVEWVAAAGRADGVQAPAAAGCQALAAHARLRPPLPAPAARLAHGKPRITGR